MSKISRKEATEGLQIKVFLSLFNTKYGTDYRAGATEVENSIIDRRALSVSKKWTDFGIQLKDIKEVDTSLFTKKIMGSGVIVFDTNIFHRLTPALKKIETKYGKNSHGILLVLNTGVSEGWHRDYEIPTWIKDMSFDGVYCLELPSNNSLTGHIYPLKEMPPIKNFLSDL